MMRLGKKESKWSRSVNEHFKFEKSLYFSTVIYSPRHYWIKWTILVRKVTKKSKFNFFKSCSKLHKDNVLDLEKPETSILKHFWLIFAQNQNLILKKKFSKFSKSPLKSEKKCVFGQKIFKNFKILELSYMVQNSIKMIFGRK